MNTEIIDKLYLELSQISKAKTTRELQYEGMLWDCYHAFRGLAEGRLKLEDVASAYQERIHQFINTNDQHSRRALAIR